MIIIIIIISTALPENPLLSFSGDFEQFFGFFSELVSPIELILFSLA